MLVQKTNLYDLENFLSLVQKSLKCFPKVSVLLSFCVTQHCHCSFMKTSTDFYTNENKLLPFNFLTYNPRIESSLFPPLGLFDLYFSFFTSIR